MKSTGYSQRNGKRSKSIVKTVPSPPFQPLRSNWRDILRQLITEHAQKNPDFLHGGKPSLRRYSLKLGNNPTLIWEWLDREPHKEPQFTSVAKLMAILAQPISVLADVPNLAVLPPPSRVPVVGIIEAGAWREAKMLDTKEDIHVSAVIDPKYAHLTQRSIAVGDTSINLVANKGDALISVSFEELGRGPQDGDLVLLERHRHGLVETTAKRFRIIEGRMRLDPESNDPDHQTPIWLHTNDSGEGEVMKVERLVISMSRMLAK